MVLACLWPQIVPVGFFLLMAAVAAVPAKMKN